MDCINHVVFDDTTQAVGDMSRLEQAMTLADYYDEQDSVSEMLAAIVDCKPEYEADLKAFVEALQQAIHSSLTTTGRAKVPLEVALANLGRCVLKHAHRHAETAIDDYIDNNWNELVYESNQPRDI